MAVENLRDGREISVTLVMVKPGGGEADYGLDVKMSVAPGTGDWITLYDPDTGSQREEFVVTQREWMFSRTGEVIEFTGLKLECEYQASDRSSAEHKSLHDSYALGVGKNNVRRVTMN